MPQLIDPLEFKKRFIALVENDPLNVAIPGMVERMCRFQLYDAETLTAYGVSSGDASFLSTVGLPEGAPCLHVRLYGIDEIELMRAEMELPHTHYPIAFDASGNPIIIDVATSAIRLFWHDEKAAPQFVNSSVSQLAESFCVVLEHLDMLTADDLLQPLRELDPPAAEEGAFWHEAALGFASLNNP